MNGSSEEAMSKRNERSGLGRRNFLTGATLAAAGAVAPDIALAQAGGGAAAPTERTPAASDIVVRSVPHLAGSETSYAYAVKAGPWLFLTGYAGFDPARGLVPEVEGPPGYPAAGTPALRREADYLIDRFARTLKELGSDLQHSVRVDQYYSSADAVRAYHLARGQGFGKYTPPSTSLIMERCFCARTNASASLVAVMPDAAYAIEPFRPTNSYVPPLSGYAPLVTCNDFVFTAGSGPEDANGTVDPTTLPRPGQRWIQPLPIRAQTAAAMKHLETVLVAGGSSLANVLKAQVYVDSTADIPDFFDVWSGIFKDHPCAVTVIPTKGFAMTEMYLEINLIALKNDARRKKEIVTVDIPKLAAQGPCVRAGELVFPSGLMAIGADSYVAGVAQAAAFDGLDYSGQVQGATLLDYAEAVCKAVGVSGRNIVRAQYFVTDVREFPGISIAWASRYGKAPHPFECVQVPGPLPAPGATTLADFWIYAA